MTKQMFTKVTNHSNDKNLAAHTVTTSRRHNDQLIIEAGTEYIPVNHKATAIPARQGSTLDLSKLAAARAHADSIKFDFS